MTEVFVHPSAVIDEGATLAEDVKVWHFCHVSAGARIGRGTSLGQNVFVGRDVIVGAGVRIQNNVSVYAGVTVEDEVFLGPSAVFTNVLRPRSAFPVDGAYAPTLVKRGATVGANATIVCGTTIGAYALVGAGATVTEDVPDHAVVAGVPARRIGWACVCGADLEGLGSGTTADCPSCGRAYRREGDLVEQA